MKMFLAGLVMTGLITTAFGQVNSQTGASGSSQTSVSASQSGVNANTNNNASANQNVRAGKKADANANTAGSASGNASVSAANMEVPSGTKVPAILDKPIDSKKCKQGDEVIAKTTADVVSNGKVIIPKNSKLIGHVTEASAKANGETDSRLGIVFDKAMLRNGTTVPMQARIQALAAPAVSAASSMSDDTMVSSPMAGGSAGGTTSGRAGGGVLGGAAGGVTQAAGSTVGTVANTSRDVTGAAGSTASSTAGGVGRAAGNTVSANGSLTNSSSGVIGLKDLQLNSDMSSTASGSVITSAGKNVKLDSGSRMVLNVVGFSSTQ